MKLLTLTFFSLLFSAVSYSQADWPQYRLIFCELEDKRPGERVFNVEINGITVIKNLDITKESGGNSTSLIKSFQQIKIDDKIILNLTAVKGKTIISGIELIYKIIN